MAINLNPGADATLVTAAARAGLAAVPADYSKTFESVANSYEKTMEAQAEMWKDIGSVVSVIGADMVANAQEWNNYKEVGEKNATYLVDELEANKQAQKELGLLPSILGDKETRDEKRRLKSRQRELFAEIDFVAKSLDDGAEAVAAGLFDENLAPQDAEIINAIIKSNLKDKITESGYQTVLSRDEKTDQLIFNLLDRDGNPVTSDATGNNLTMTMKEFNKSIATNVKDTKNVIGNAMGTIENDIVTAGQTSKSDVIDEQTIQLSLNRLDGLLQTDTDVRRAMLAKYGIHGTSFADDIKTKTMVSEEIYASLVRTIGVEKSGQVKAEDTLEGIADTDGILGLSQEEINNAYGTYSTNILGMKDPEVSKAVFKASYADRMRKAHIYGYSRRTPTPGDGIGTETKTNPHGLSLSKKGKYGLGLPSKGTSYVPQYDVGYVTNKIDNLKSGTQISFQGGVYTYREVDGATQWWKNYGKGESYDDPDVEGVGIGTVVGTAKDMAEKVFHVDDPIFTSIVTEREQEVPDDITGLLPSENPFADKQATAEGQAKPRTVPNDFTKAFGKLTGSDNAVVKYLRDMNVPGLVVGNYQGGGSLNYPDNDNRKLVEPISTYDDVILTLGGKTKLFVTDPSFTDDIEGAQEIWNWLHENFSGNNDKVEW